MFLLSKSVSSSYSQLGIILFIQIIFLTLLRGLFQDIFGSEYLIYLGPFMIPLGILFLASIIRLIYNLGVNKRYITFVLLLLFTAIALRVSTVFFISDAYLRSNYSMISSLLILILQITCVYFMCINL